MSIPLLLPLSVERNAHSDRGASGERGADWPACRRAHAAPSGAPASTRRPAWASQARPIARRRPRLCGAAHRGSSREGPLGPKRQPSSAPSRLAPEVPASRGSGIDARIRRNPPRARLLAAPLVRFSAKAALMPSLRAPLGFPPLSSPVAARLRSRRRPLPAPAVTCRDPGAARARFRAGPGWPAAQTSGVLRTANGDTALISGYNGPSKAIPLGTPGMNGNIKSHVEAHAASIMRLQNAGEGTLFINRVPCSGPRGCGAMSPRMLPEGSRLQVLGPGGYDKTFTGLPDK